MSPLEAAVTVSLSPCLGFVRATLWGLAQPVNAADEAKAPVWVSQGHTKNKKRLKCLRRLDNVLSDMLANQANPKHTECRWL